jgi:hypothetical protein
MPVFAGCVLLAAQYYAIYQRPEFNRLASAFGQQDAGIAVGWLHVWRHYSRNIPLSILTSVLLPLLVVLRYPKTSLSDRRNLYALALLATGIMVSCLLYETGAREFNANFFWQNIVANYLLHLAVMVSYCRQKLTTCFTKYDYVIVSVFILEVLSGMAYVVRIPLTGHYG